MNSSIDILKSKWQSAKESKSTPALDDRKIIELSESRIKKTVIMQYWTIGILSLTLIGLIAYFSYTGFQNLLSHIGIGLMTGGLAFRILIEVYSIIRSKKIDMAASLSENNQTYLSYYTYRKQIHGPVTIKILIAYTVGFYMLIPEFSLYLSSGVTALLACSYLIAAAIFGYSIRKGIRDEMALLDEVIQIQKETYEE